MSIQILQNIINDFDLNRFRLFFREKNRGFKPSYDILEHENESGIVNGETIGVIPFENGNLSIYTFKIKKELTERSGKKTQYELGKKILKNTQSDAGIFIFYDNENNFRFSLIYADYQGTKRDWSTFKRFTYFVSAELTNRTYLERIGTGDFSTLNNIKEAFSVEKVTKEFYREFKDIFEFTRSKINGIEKVNRHDYTMLLFNRLLFLKFLEKKSWLDYNKTYFKDLYSKYKANNKATNFYNNYLKYLFFYALNNISATYKVRHNETLKELLGIVPFLNGGLFEMTEMESQSIEIPDEVFECIFAFFNNYNFTVTENTPLDIEVAVDPEMLGKVFENLINSPEDEEKGKNRRKETGSFYTPRDIVVYMCRESLKNFLANSLNLKDISVESIHKFVDIDDVSGIKNPELVLDKLREVKICDPACGSGAFLVQMLHELVRLRRVLFKYDTISADDDYFRKLQIIQNNLYGTDIQKFASEIAMLRFWLSLIVDYGYDFKNKKDFEDNVNRIPSLPNLTYKIRSGDSLVEMIGGVVVDKKMMDALTHTVNLKPIFEKLNAARAKFIKASGENKIKLQKEIDEHETLLHKHVARIYKTKIDKEVKSIFWEINFPEVMLQNKGFDIIIGNPPYGVSIKGAYRKAVLKTLGKVPDFEIYYYFVELAYKFLSPKGTLAFIIPNTFLFNVFASDFRKSLLKKWQIYLVLDCSLFKIFENATIMNAIVFFGKELNDTKVGYKNTSEANSFEKLINKETSYVMEKELLSNNQNWGLVFKLNQSTLNLISKIRDNSSPLEKLFPEYSQGLIAYDKYQGQSKKIIETRAYHYSAKVKPTLKNWLWGEDVNRFVVKWNGKEWIEYGDGIANPRQPKFFKGKRILIREITNPSIFCAFTEDEFYHDPSIIVVLESDMMDIKCLLGIFNSKLASFYHFNAAPKATKGAFPKILIDDVKRFPIPEMNASTQKIFTNIINKYLRIKSRITGNHSVVLNELDNQIDLFIYKLYNLNYEEVKIIDPEIGKNITYNEYKELQINNI